MNRPRAFYCTTHPHGPDMVTDGSWVPDDDDIYHCREAMKGDAPCQWVALVRPKG